MPIFEQLFGGGSHLAQVLGLLQLAITVWMMFDAYRRGADTYWYWVIFFFQPVGAWIYFFVVKLPTLRWPRIKLSSSESRHLSLDQLRYAVERAPTVANRLALAERLMEKGCCIAMPSRYWKQC